MNHNQIRWDYIHKAREGDHRTIFQTYCSLIDSCDQCDPKLRFLCKIKNWIQCIQTDIIKKILNNRP